LGRRLFMKSIIPMTYRNTDEYSLNNVSKNFRITKRKVFYFLLILSLLMLLIGVILPGKIVDSGIFSITLGDYKFDLRARLLTGAFGLWAWIIIYGFFIKKKPLEWVIMIVLFIPHLILILVMKEYSHGIGFMLRMYLGILSFWSIVIRG
jgi:hypothetical protein